MTDNCFHTHKSSPQLNPDETICIDQTKHRVCLMHSVIRDNFHSVHNKLNVRVSETLETGYK